MEQTVDDGPVFYSPTWGTLSLAAIHDRVMAFIAEHPDASYQVVIGTDSQPSNGNGTDFITAIVVRRIGNGGIYFWRRIADNRRMVLRSRMYQEATLSLVCGQDVMDVFKRNGLAKYDVEIHVDIGKNGDTREMIAEIVGMIRGSGFAVKIKPDSFAASNVADRHT